MILVGYMIEVYVALVQFLIFMIIMTPIMMVVSIPIFFIGGCLIYVYEKLTYCRYTGVRK